MLLGSIFQQSHIIKTQFKKENQKEKASKHVKSEG